MSLRRWVGAWVWLWACFLGSACARRSSGNDRARQAFDCCGPEPMLPNSPPFYHARNRLRRRKRQLVATNAHVIAGATDQDGSTLTVRFVRRGRRIPNCGGSSCWLTDRDHDLAVLQMEGRPCLIWFSALRIRWSKGSLSPSRGLPIGAGPGLGPGDPSRDDRRHHADCPPAG